MAVLTQHIPPATAQKPTPVCSSRPAHSRRYFVSESDTSWVPQPRAAGGRSRPLRKEEKRI